jgi:hypothetical protein
MTEPVVPGEHLSDEEMEEHRKTLDEAEALAREIKPVRMTREQLKAKLLKKERDDQSGNL